MNKKYVFFTQFIRHLVQLAAFILFPGLFITLFSAVRDILAAMMDGSFSVGSLFFQLVLISVTVLITALWGRFFCGFLCSFGMLQELVFFCSKRVLSGKIQIPERFDHMMKYLKFVILVLIVAGVWIPVLSVDSSWDPWGVFGMLVSGNLSVVSMAIPTVGFALLLAIVVGSLFVERFFCRYLCPLGALFAVISAKRVYRIKRQSASCTNCGLCTRTCGMGIDIPKGDAIVSPECIQCMHCVEICPKESLLVNPAGALAGTAAAAAIGGTVVVGNLVSFPVTETVSDQQVIEKKEKGNYQDGVYTGVGEGFRGTTKVQVTVEDGYIADITVLSFMDDKEFFNKAQSALISAILTEQSLDVGTVSGATFSSNSILEAVADALGSMSDAQPKQDIDKEDANSPEELESADNFVETDEGGNSRQPSEYDEVQATEEKESEPDSGPKTDSEAGQFSVADGIYEGTGKGFRGTTSVSVTVENGEITDITVNSYEDDTAYFTRAQDAVIGKIISSQSLNVQAVSGATFSSNSILEAVADALGSEPGRAQQSVDEGNGGRSEQRGAGEDNGNEQGGQSGTEGGNGNGQGGQSGTGGGNGNGQGGQSGTGAGNGNGQGDQPGTGAGNGNGQGGQSGAGAGNGNGQGGQPGAGGGNGHGQGQSGNGGHGKGWRDGSGKGGHRGGK